MTAPTNAQLKQMLQDDERERRARRTELGLSPAQHGTRIPSKKRKDAKGNRGNHRANYAKEY